MRYFCSLKDTTKRGEKQSRDWGETSAYQIFSRPPWYIYIEREKSQKLTVRKYQIKNGWEI